MLFTRTIALMIGATSLVQGAPDPNDDPVITDIIYMQTTLGDIEIGLFGDIVPKTAKNFADLAPIYEETGTIFHRVIDNFMIQSGDIDGKGGHSIYGERGSDPKYGNAYSGLLDENFILKHDQIGRVSVANSGPNTGGSQFFICLNPQPHLDGKHVVFGQVINGLDIVKEIGKVKTDRYDKPIDDVVIKKCYSKSASMADDLDTGNGDNGDNGDNTTPPPPPPPQQQQETPPDSNEDPIKGATSIVFFPLIIFALALIILGLKNKNRFMYLIRGPRYRRVISVNGETSN